MTAAASRCSTHLPHPDLPAPRNIRAWRWLEQIFDRAFDSAHNPLRQLGALGFLAFWMLAVSGIWLYAVFDSSVAGAYESIEQLSARPWSAGGLMRSLHRYSADAFVILVALHLLREAVHGRWRFFRRFSWLTGTATLPLVAISAVGGFWLSWDRLSQYSATATAELLDALPLLANPLARNFLDPAAVSDRLFSLFVFVHLGVPLLLLFALWFHLQRLTRAVVFPTLRLGAGMMLALLALAVVAPVAGQGRADLAVVPEPVSLDWILLFVHPLTDATSAGLVWLLLLGTLALLFVLPFGPTMRARVAPASPGRAPVAVVDPANCSGCRYCFADCPYAAITMVAHPNARIGRELAVVDANLCASCGICAGSCPSSTPFRSAAELITGIDMPQRTVHVLRQQLLAALQASRCADPIVIFQCEHAGRAAAPGRDDAVVVPLLCAGQLPPAFIDYALHHGASGVFIAACRETGCEFRLGARWTRERMQTAREPRLRLSVSRERVMRNEADTGEETVAHEAMLAFREALAGDAMDTPSHERHVAAEPMRPA